MIRGHKPAAYTETGDGIRKWTREQRQCVHCQFLWTYRPGSGTRRGYCLRCDGFLCARPECATIQRQILAQFAHLSGATDRHCMPYTDWIERCRDAYAKDPKYQVLPSGLVIEAQ